MEHLDHPFPHFNDAKMAHFLLLPAFIIALGGRGLIVPFYSVQDCSFLANCYCCTERFPLAVQIIFQKKQMLRALCEFLKCSRAEELWSIQKPVVSGKSLLN